MGAGSQTPLSCIISFNINEHNDASAGLTVLDPFKSGTFNLTGSSGSNRTWDISQFRAPRRIRRPGESLNCTRAPGRAPASWPATPGRGSLGGTRHLMLPMRSFNLRVSNSQKGSRAGDPLEG